MENFRKIILKRSNFHNSPFLPSGEGSYCLVFHALFHIVIHRFTYYRAVKLGSFTYYAVKLGSFTHYVKKKGEKFGVFAVYLYLCIR